MDLNFNPDEETIGTLEIKNLKDISIDLNGHTLTLVETAKKGISFTNSKVKFVDSVGGGKLVCKNTSEKVETDGLFLEKSTVEFSGIDYESDSIYGIVLLAPAREGDAGSKLIVNKGIKTDRAPTITQNGGMAAIALEKAGVFEFNAGILTSNASKTTIMCCNESSAVINGGTIKNTAAKEDVDLHDVIIGVNCTIDIGGDSRIEGAGQCALQGLNNCVFNIDDNASVESRGDYTAFVSAFSKLIINSGKLNNSCVQGITAAADNGSVINVNDGELTSDDTVLCGKALSDIYVNGGSVRTQKEEGVALYSDNSNVAIDGGDIAADAQNTCALYFMTTDLKGTSKNLLPPIRTAIKPSYCTTFL